jgi:hypothetical protein
VQRPQYTLDSVGSMATNAMSPAARRARGTPLPSSQPPARKHTATHRRDKQRCHSQQDCGPRPLQLLSSSHSAIRYADVLPPLPSSAPRSPAVSAGAPTSSQTPASRVAAFAHAVSDDLCSQTVCGSSTALQARPHGVAAAACSRTAQQGRILHQHVLGKGQRRPPGV